MPTPAERPEVLPARIFEQLCNGLEVAPVKCGKRLKVDLELEEGVKISLQYSDLVTPQGIKARRESASHIDPDNGGDEFYLALNQIQRQYGGLLELYSDSPSNLGEIADKILRGASREAQEHAKLIFVFSAKITVAGYKTKFLASENPVVGAFAEKVRTHLKRLASPTMQMEIWTW